MTIKSYLSRMFACGIVSVIAGCGGGGKEITTLDSPTPIPNSTGLGLVELDISGIGSSRPTSEMRWDDSSARARALSAKAATVANVPAGMDILFQSSSSVDIGARGNGGIRYISVTYKVRNAQACATPGTCPAYTVQRKNLTFLAAVTSTSIAGSGISRFRLFNGDPAPSGLATQLLPTHGMNATATSVDAQRASMQVYRDSELPAVDPAATDVLPYGFVVSNAVNGSRILPANPAANQFDGLVTFAFKIPLQATEAQDPFKVTMRFQVLEDANTRVTQSVEEIPASVKARADAMGVTDVAVLCNGASPVPGANPICGARVAGTAASPSSFIATPPTSPGSPVVLLAPVNLLNVAPTADIVIGTSEAMKIPTAATLVVHGSQSGLRTLTGAYAGSYAGGTTTKPNQLVFKLGASDRPFFRGEQVSFTATAGNTSLAGNAALTKYVGSFTVAGSSAYTAGPWPAVRGTGNFAPPANPPVLGPPPTTAYNAVFTTGNARSVLAGDLNGDGKLDLVVLDASEQGTVSVLMGDGTGGFSSATAFPVGFFPKSMALGDVNGDGKLDIVATTEDGISVLLGDGAGGFSNPSAFPTSFIPGKVLLGDINADGKLDVVVGGFVADGGAISVLLGNGSGGFAAAVSYATGGDVVSFALGDVNGDGRLDVAVISKTNNTSNLAVLLGQASSPLLAAPTNSPLDDDFGDLALGDVNGDGSLDVVLVTRSPVPDLYSASPGATVCIGNGSGAFVIGSRFASLSRSQTIVLADLNGDSKLDALLWDAQNGLGVLAVLGGGETFGTGVSSTMFGQFPFGEFPGARGGWVLGDFNGDGILDGVWFIDTGEGRVLLGY